MFKVGILGTENSHAAAFTGLINSVETKYPDFKVVALYGIDNATSQAIVDKYPGDYTICNSPEEMVDLVDCAMITARHGKYHKPFAMPFIKAGKPVFIDKPFAISNEDAKELLDTAEALGVPVNGGTGCKYCKDFVDFKAEIRDTAKIGNLKNAVMTFAADVHSEYGGFYFYGAHLAEMALNCFGYHPNSVTAYLKNDYLSAVVRYDEYDIYLSFAKSYTAVAYGDKSYVFKTIGLADIYDFEMSHFTEMVRTGKSPMAREELEMPIKLLNAIEQSLKTGLPVAL